MEEVKISDLDRMTVIVRHKVIPGYEGQYETWAQGISQVVKKFSGCQGANLIKPTDASKQEYVIIFKFNSYENLRQWEDSPERREWAEKRKSFVVDEPDIQHYKGWDYWFTLPSQAKVAPPRYKMAIITWISIYPLAFFIPRLMNPFTHGLPSALEVLILAAVIVPLMAWGVMPLMIKAFSRWLYPHKN